MGAYKRASLDKSEVKSGTKEKWRKNGDRRESGGQDRGQTRYSLTLSLPGAPHRCQAPNPGKNQLSR